VSSYKVRLARCCRISTPHATRLHADHADVEAHAWLPHKPWTNAYANCFATRPPVSSSFSTLFFSLTVCAAGGGVCFGVPGPP
jgi:hypothetical protein